MKHKAKIRYDRVVIFILGVMLVSFLCFLILSKMFNIVKNVLPIKDTMYLSSDSTTVLIYDENFNEVSTLPRGTKVEAKNKVSNDEQNYYKVVYEKKEYYVKEENLTKNEEEIVKEKEMYVRTSLTFYESIDSINILGLIKKGEKVSILDIDKVNTDGIVNMYKIEYDGKEGYVYGKYLVNNYDDSIKNYDEENTYQTHASRLDNLGGGSGATLDYYPVSKPTFENNVMPSEVRALYMNAGVIKNVDKYIQLAKDSGINAFVVDIKDNTSPGYPAKAMQEYSITNYNKALNSYDEYKSAIQKLKDNGFYVIGRITVFKDSYYAKDHPEDTIIDTSTGTSYDHDGSYWPSAYKRNVWQFNVALAIESVEEMGFNEIQFDYVRFPDRVRSLELAGKISYGNTYNETKAEAIQRFVMYACDEIHKYNAYVSIDVFGESAHNYVTAYGQYFPAISNVADVISAMPYPDHFSKYEYDFDEVVWTVPYKLLDFWSKNYVVKRQSEIPTPAIVRTWIQAYNTSKSPSTTYDSYMVSEQIKALYNNGLTGGFMTWNGSSSLEKYTELLPAFGKEY
jgi:hypothetical protein